MLFFFFQAEDGIRDRNVTGVQTCALPIYRLALRAHDARDDPRVRRRRARARRPHAHDLAHHVPPAALPPAPPRGRLVDGGPRHGPPHSSSEGGYAPLGLPRHARGATAKPWHPSILRQVPLARLPLLEALQQALGLLEVALGVDVLGLQVEHDLPLGDGLGQLLLAEESDAFLVVAVDDLAPRLRQQT